MREIVRKVMNFSRFFDNWKIRTICRVHSEYSMWRTVVGMKRNYNSNWLKQRVRKETATLMFHFVVETWQSINLLNRNFKSVPMGRFFYVEYSKKDPSLTSLFCLWILVIRSWSWFRFSRSKYQNPVQESTYRISEVVFSSNECSTDNGCTVICSIMITMRQKIVIIGVF